VQSCQPSPPVDATPSPGHRCAARDREVIGGRCRTRGGLLGRWVERPPGRKRSTARRISFVDDQTQWVDTEIRFELADSGGATEVRFTHQGLVPDYECYDACSNAWGQYVGSSLRNLITTGTGRPISSPDDERHREKARVG